MIERRDKIDGEEEKEVWINEEIFEKIDACFTTNEINSSLS